ncbi:MAG: SRPBCC family protein [Kutzneria sp.]|nr:SRPBCC family protein [Kutzneria sp.]
MSHSAYYSAVLDRPAREVWNVVRDFNSYPIWVNGVDDSHIEDDLSGTTVGCVRNFAIRGSRTRQRLWAHSDSRRYLTYEGCGPFRLEVDGAARTIGHYKGTLRITPIVADDHSFAEWSSRYECSAGDADFWADWWDRSLPEWMSSLRDHLSRTGTGSPEATSGGMTCEQG